MLLTVLYALIPVDPDFNIRVDIFFVYAALMLVGLMRGCYVAVRRSTRLVRIQGTVSILLNCAVALLLTTALSAFIFAITNGSDAGDPEDVVVIDPVAEAADLYAFLTVVLGRS